MPKKETLQIQKKIHELGKQLGFISAIEEPLHGNEHYAPKYDAVWYLDLEKSYNLSRISKLFQNAPELFARIKRLPFAGFEIEGSATTSKNQLGNFANLYCGNFLYNFVVVNNSKANGENDTYRRGVKLKRYISENIGDKNLFFFDWVHLKRSITELKTTNNKMVTALDDFTKRKTSGGETASIPLYKKILPLLKNSGLSVSQNYQPWLYDIKYKIAQDVNGGDLKQEVSARECFRHFYTGQAFFKMPHDSEPTKVKKITENLYIPKIDICMGFTAPRGFVAWLTELADAIGCYGVAQFPILYALQRRLKLVDDFFVPLIGIEIETSINKHLSGGILNLAKNTYAGVVVTKASALKHVEFYKKELGINNVTAYCEEE